MFEEENPIRSDLWPIMDINELNIQRELILNKITLLSSMPYSQAVMNIKGALDQALLDVDGLLEHRFMEGARQYPTTRL
jgi:hypothetical protein